MPSSEPEARVSPPGLKSTEKTAFEWPSREAITPPVAGSHSFTAPPSAPETSLSPSGLKPTE